MGGGVFYFLTKSISSLIFPASHCLIKLDVFVKSQKLTNLSSPRKRESSNYKQLWIPDQVGNDKTTEIRIFK